MPAVLRSTSSRRWASTVARVVLGAILVYAGSLKAFDPVTAVRAVDSYEVFPYEVARIVGYGLPWLEIALGLVLLAGLAIRAAAVVSSGLMVVFIVGVASAWARGLSIDCGCFGGGGAINPDQTQYLQEIGRDLLFLGLATWLVFFPHSRWSLDPAPEPDPAAQAAALEDTIA